MGGDVRLREDAAWVVSFGVYDNIIGKVRQQLLVCDQPHLARIVEQAQDPYLRHLDLRGLDASSMKAFLDAAEHVYEAVQSAGPTGYGGHPSVYQNVMNDFAELLRLLRSDFRLAP